VNSSAAAVLCDPRPPAHIVYSYADDNDLADAVALFASAGLSKKEAVILIVTVEHENLIRQRLEQEGFDQLELQRSGQLVFANAENVLTAFLLGGIIDEQQFKTGIGSLIDSVRKGVGTRSVRVFGEMVDLIWTSNLLATLRLEQLWNEAIESHSVTVLCAYSVGGSKPTSLPEPILACHSHALSTAHDDVAELRCPNCGSTDLVSIQIKAIHDKFMECRSCNRPCAVKRDADGRTRLVTV
jgi:hypothetical protein